jgi:uncharacterized membrane protein (DUF4010 family)
VLLFSALNFAGYLARKAVGAERGYGVTGLLGGLVSSTAVTFQFSRLSRDDPSLGTGLAVGVMGASTVLLPRILVISTLLNADVARALLPFLVPPMVVGAILLLVAAARRWEPVQKARGTDVIQNPLRLTSAIKMALAFQASLMLISYVSNAIGASGVLASAALIGLTDMDALTLSMSRLGTTPDLVRLAARAIAIGLLGNSALKIALTIGLGTSRYRQLALAGLAALAITGAISLTVFW